MCLLAILNLSCANNYLTNILQFRNKERPTRPPPNHTNEPRCSLFLDKKNYLNVDLNTPSIIEYDDDLHMLKMIIDNKIGLVLIEIENEKRRTRMEGTYYTSFADHGTAHGICVW